MKNKVRFLFFIVALFTITGQGNAQEKYAVLICGDYSDVDNIPPEEL